MPTLLSTMDLPTLIHVGAAAIALVAGTLAVALRKGGVGHKQAGYLFVATMIIMAVPAALMSFNLGKPFDVLSSVLTVYMVLTALLAFRPERRVAAMVMMALAGVCIAGYVGIEIDTQLTGVRNTDAPVGVGYVFATILGLGLWGDIRSQRAQRTPRQTRIRHLWRMNFGFFMATANLFGVRPHLFPEWMQSSGLLVLLALAPLLVMAVWRFKLRSRSAASD